MLKPEKDKYSNFNTGSYTSKLKKKNHSSYSGSQSCDWHRDPGLLISHQFQAMNI